MNVSEMEHCLMKHGLSQGHGIYGRIIGIEKSYLTRSEAVL